MSDLDRVEDFVRQYVDANGFAPTFREIGDGIGVSSPSTIHHLIHQMMENGLATMVRGRSRTLRLVNRDEDLGRVSRGAGG